MPDLWTDRTWTPLYIFVRPSLYVYGRLTTDNLIFIFDFGLNPD